MMGSSQHMAYVGLGSNLGDREATIESAIRSIAELGGVEVVAVSSSVQTPPLPTAEGVDGGGWYVNAVVTVRTVLEPGALLEGLLAIERAHGRDRSVSQRWAARTLDLDLLLFDDRMIDEPRLVVPHPHIASRRFVLEPLAEITPDSVIPGLGKTAAQLLAELEHAEMNAKKQRALTERGA